MVLMDQKEGPFAVAVTMVVVVVVVAAVEADVVLISL